MLKRFFKIFRWFLFALFFLIIITSLSKHAKNKIEISDISNLNTSDILAIKFIDCINDTLEIDKNDWYEIKTLLTKAKKTNKIGSKGSSWKSYFTLVIYSNGKKYELEFTSRAKMFKEGRHKLLSLDLNTGYSKLHYGYYNCLKLFIFIDKKYNKTCYNDLRRLEIE